MHQELAQAAALLALNTPDSFEEAVSLLRKVVYSFSMRLCRHREDAEDTAQEVMIRSIRHLRRFQDPKRLAAWLYVVTRNRYRRMCRENYRYVASPIPLDELQLCDGFTTRYTDDARNSPEAALVRMEERRLLLGAIQRIPLSLRSVLVLHDMRQLSTLEIAKMLALQQGTVRVRLHRARSRAHQEMRTILAQKMGRHDLVSSAY